jgi:predicted phosphodiesterase
VKIGIVTDAHLCPPGTAADRFHNEFEFAGARSRLERALALHAAAGVDAIALLGDLTNAGDEASTLEGLPLCEAVGLPVWAVAGNHDCDEGAGAFRDRLAGRPATSIQIPTPSGDVAGSIRLAGLSIVACGPSRKWTLEQPDIAAWRTDTVLLLSHFPILSRRAAAAAAGLQYAGDVENHKAVEDMLRARSQATVVLHGHLHQRDAVTSGPVLQLGCASLIEPPFETAQIEIEPMGADLIVRVSHLSVEPPPNVRLPVLSPAQSIWRFRAGAWACLS